METVIAIPLFMILLGGIMWIGDLMVTRQQLLIANRYVVWNYGCRYNPGGYDAATLHERFFDSSEYRKPKDVQTQKKDYDWSVEASGKVHLDMKMPDWTRFMFNAGSVMFGGGDHGVEYGAGAPEENVELNGRSQDGGQMILMRTQAEADPGYIRNKYGIPESGQVAKKWRDIYGEKWPYE